MSVDGYALVVAKGMTLGQAFDPRRNVLNTWRLALAASVIVWHSYPLTGHNILFAPLQHLVGEVGVDGFFAISGFLITGSWLNNPRLRTYFASRGLRIYPGLVVCLAVTAFVIAPIGVAIQGGPVAQIWRSSAPFDYVWKNTLMMVWQPSIAGTPRGTPWPGKWNGPIWTLIPEMLCYIVIGLVGAIGLGLVARRCLITAALALALTWSALLPSVGTDLHGTLVTGDRLAARFGAMFLAGALLHQFRDLIPARWSLVSLSVAFVLGASFMPDYRVIGAIPLAYAIIVSGVLVRNERLRLETDLSYGVYIYGWPLQELLVICGVGVLNPLAFAVVAIIAVLPFAALSWFLVEKRALSLKSRLKRKSSALAEERRPVQTVSD
jgi:peptidoglycan/LPS O-acetylase OafA/YrhL